MRHWLTTLLVVISLSACSSTVAGTPKRAKSSGSVEELTAMLLSVEEVGRIVGAQDLEISETYQNLVDYAEFTPEQCAGVPFNTIERAYRNSGHEAVSGITMQTPGQVQWVDEGVVRFATAEAAHRFVTEAEPIWRECEGVQAHAVPDKDTGLQIWAIGETVRLDDSTGLMARASRVDEPGDQCAHAMADRADLIIDVTVCGPQVGDEAVTLLNRIADRPPV